MDISMWMVHDRMEGSIWKVGLNQLGARRALTGALPYLEGSVSDDRHLYILDATGPATVLFPEDATYLAIIGDAYEGDIPDGCQYLVLDGSKGAAVMQARILELFERYRNWGDDLDRACGRGDLDGICEVGYRFIENSIFIFDHDYTIIGMECSPRSAEQMPDRFIRRDELHYAISPDTLVRLRDNPGFRQADGIQGAALCPDEEVGDTLYVNLGRSKRYEGRLCISCDVHPHRKGDYQIAEILASSVRTVLLSHTPSKDMYSQVFRAFLQSLSDGRDISERQISDSLRLMGWKAHAPYVCMALDLGEDDMDAATVSYLCAGLESTLVGASTFSEHAQIVCVIPLHDPLPAVEHGIWEQVGELIADIGVSNVFSDIHLLHEYRIEASMALHEGHAYADEHFHHFDAYAIRCFYDCGTSKLPVLHYIDDDVRMLLDYRGTKTDFYDTLKIYLDNDMNLLRSSEQLFIHRTTLFKRIEKIRMLLAGDLDDPSVRKRMRFSFMLMEMAEDRAGAPTCPRR